MFKNYLKIAFRSFKKHQGYSFINILGLALGLACAILMAAFVYYELSYDRHHERENRIYRIGCQYGPGSESRGAYTAPPMAKAMRNEFPEIEHIARLSLWPSNSLVSFEDKRFLEKGIIDADAAVFDVFTIPFIWGDAGSALLEPYSIVITQNTSQRYFGDENPLGRTLRIDNQKNEYLITGVVENCPSTSHFQFDMIISLVTDVFSRSERWMSHTYFTYIVLDENASPAQLEAKFPDFILRHYSAQFFADTGMSYSEYLKDENHYYGYWLQPLRDIHLNAAINDNLPNKGNRMYNYVFSLIAFFILLLACINFMNLSTARFALRSKEVGVRKVLGSSRLQLVKQFMGESVLLSLTALVVALAGVGLFLPAFRQLAGRNLELAVFPLVWWVPALLGLALLVGLLAGSYPAFFLSSFQPVKTMQGTFSRRAKGFVPLRRVLVILQFSITIVIFLGTFVIYRQLTFISKAELGFNKEQVVVLHRSNSLGKEREPFKQELLKNSRILTVSSTNSLPGRHFDPNGHRLEGRPMTEEYTLFTMYGDPDFAELLDLTMAQGRYFSWELASDANSVVINETAARKLGLDEPLGKRFHKEFGGAKKGEFVTIVGVVKDIHFHSLHHEIQPMLIRFLPRNRGYYTSIKILPDDIPATLRFIKDTWSTFNGEQPCEYSWLDEDFAALYTKEQKSGQVFALFSLLAIVIASLGLLGLISFAAEQRTREIGIRKVIGASVSHIFFLLSREVVFLVMIATCIASPVAYLVMNRWLHNFAFRIHIQPQMFILTALVVLSVAILSISYRALKAAHTNPADAIKYE